MIMAKNTKTKATQKKSNPKNSGAASKKANAKMVKAKAIKKKTVVKKNNVKPKVKAKVKAMPKSSGKSRVASKATIKVKAKPAHVKAKVSPKKPIVKASPVKSKAAAVKPPAAVISKPVKPQEQVKEKKVTPAKEKENGPKLKYSDKDLAEFKAIILDKLSEAKHDLDLLRSSMSHLDDHGTDDTSPTFKLMEDGSDVLTKEETAQLAARQQKFIKHLEDALVRIENKSYGICRVTGNLIPKERLRVVPHATLSIEAKQKQF